MCPSGIGLCFLIDGSRMRKIIDMAILATTIAGTKYYYFIVIDLVSSKIIIMSSSPNTKP